MKDEEFELGRVEAHELEAIMKMANTKLKETYSMELFQHFFENFRGCFFSARCNKEPIGFLIGIPRDASSLRILMLVVIDAHSRKGVGSALMDASQTYASSRKMTTMVLEVGTENDQAVNFYTKLGLSISGMLQAYYEDGSAAFLMRKLISM